MSIICAACGTRKAVYEEGCDYCGSSVAWHCANLVGQQTHATLGQPGTVADQYDAARNERRITVQTPEGDTSLSVHTATEVLGDVEGHRMGRRGEDRAIRTLTEALEKLGYRCDTFPSDHPGQDRLLRVDDRELTAEITTIPADENVWRSATLGIGQIRLPRDQAVEAIRERVDSKCCKTSPAERKSRVLVLDANHAAGFAGLVEEYLVRYGDPSIEYGISSVWIVGPTAYFGLTVRLGGGYP